MTGQEPHSLLLSPTFTCNSPYVLGGSWAEQKREGPSPLRQTEAIVCSETQAQAPSGWMWGSLEARTARGAPHLLPALDTSGLQLAAPGTQARPRPGGEVATGSCHQRQGGAWRVGRQRQRLLSPGCGVHGNCAPHFSVFERQRGRDGVAQRPQSIAVRGESHMCSWHSTMRTQAPSIEWGVHTNCPLTL